MFGPMILAMNVLRQFFSTKEKPITDDEFVEFWVSLTSEERVVFRLFAYSLWNDTKRAA